MKKVNIITTDVWQKVEVQNFSENCTIKANWIIAFSHLKNPWVDDQVNLWDWEAMSLWMANLVPLWIKWEDTAFIEVFYNVKGIA